MSGSCHSEVYGRKIGKRTRGKGSKKDSIDRTTKNDQLATKTTYPWPALNGATLMERPAHRRRIFRDTFSLLFAILSFVHPPPNKVFLPAKRILSCSRLTTVLRIGLPHREYPISPSVSPWIEAVFSFLFFHEPTKWHYVAKPWIRKNCYCRDKFTFFFFFNIPLSSRHDILATLSTFPAMRPLSSFTLYFYFPRLIAKTLIAHRNRGYYTARAGVRWSKVFDRGPSRTRV